MNQPGHDPQQFIQQYRDTYHSRDASIIAADREILDAILKTMRLKWAAFSGADDLHERAFPSGDV
jgi:hypothetical protein